MRLRHIVILLLIGLTPVHAQYFGNGLMSLQGSDGLTQSWFRRMVWFDSAPRQVVMTVVTNGFADVYVNGRNVSSAVFVPCRTSLSDDVLGVSFDVTRFFHSGNNAVALWQSPQSGQTTRPVVAVELSGIRDDGTRFCITGSGEWLCKAASRRFLPSGEEVQEGSTSVDSWTHGEMEVALWSPPEELDADLFGGYEIQLPYANQLYSGITTPADSTWVENDSLVCRFDKVAEGRVRVTLRNAKKGERISINGLQYICTGQTDEQAFHKFTTIPCRTVVITGDSRFSPSQVQTVEAITVVPRANKSYNY